MGGAEVIPSPGFGDTPWGRIQAQEELERQMGPGFRSAFSGEELRRANAALAGSLVGGTIKAFVATDMPPSLAQLSTLTADDPSARPPSDPAHNYYQHSASFERPGSVDGGPGSSHAARPVRRTPYSSLSPDPADVAARELTYTALMYTREREEVAAALGPLLPCGPMHAEDQHAAGGAPHSPKAGPQLTSAPHSPGLGGRPSIAAAQRALGGAGGPKVDPAALGYDTLYSHGLVLQELAARAAPASPEHVGYLKQACDRYDEAVQVRPGAASALYNWGVALSDLAHAAHASNPQAARACLEAAAARYAAALAAQPGNTQALNNWGLVLQEMSSSARDAVERDTLLRQALSKFRHAVRLRPDFDRGVYNLGTVCYAYACTLQGEIAVAAKGGSGSSGHRGDAPPAGALSVVQALVAEQGAARAREAREVEARSLFTCSAEYICLAYALQPGRDIYRKSLGVVKQLLPLPFLRVGWLMAPLQSTRGTYAEAWRRDWYVLDHTSLRVSSSTTGHAAARTSHGSGPAVPLAAVPDGGMVIPLALVVAAGRGVDPSLPPGPSFWIQLEGEDQAQWLVAEEEDAADAWADALALGAHIVRCRSAEALSTALAPTALHSRNSHSGSGL